jgi:putative RecB family exonuclease
VISLPDHISYSQINTYLICPQKYKYQYIHKLEWPFIPAALTFGSAIHSALEKFYMDRLLGTESNSDCLKDAFNIHLLKDAAEKEMKFKNGFDPVELQNLGCQMIDCFLKNVTPGNVLGVEEKFKVDLIDTETGEVIEVPLVGAVDLIEQTSDGNIVLVDFKTSSARYNEDAVHRDLQLSAYSLYARTAYAGEGDSVSLRLNVLLKTRTPQYLTYKTERTPADGQRFVRIARKIWSAIQGENFYPNPGWQCTDCPFREVCENDILN